MKINNFRGDLTDISAKKEALDAARSLSGLSVVATSNYFASKSVFSRLVRREFSCAVCGGNARMIGLCTRWLEVSGGISCPGLRW